MGDRTCNYLFAGAAVLPKTRKQSKTSFRRIDTDQDTLETLNWLLCFTSSDRFLSAMFTNGLLQVY